MRSSLVSLVALTSLAFTASAAGAQHGGPVPMHMPPLHFTLASDTVVVPFVLREGKIVFPLEIDGKGPFPFVFDTGAHGSVLDLAFAREQGLALGDSVRVGSPGGGGRTGYFTTLGRVELGGLAVDSLRAAAFDGLPFRGDDRPRGVLGPYGFSGLLVTLDYPHSRLVFTRGALPEPDGRDVFGWDAAQPLPLIPIRIAGRTLDAHLDSGAKHGISLPPDFAKTLKFKGKPVAAGEAHMVDQHAPAMRAQLDGEFALGRYSLHQPTIYYSEVHQEVANVGPPVLEQFALTLDPANHRLRLAGPANGRLVDEPAAN